MESKEIRKITRRTTRSKTQFINFNKEEINNLRIDAANTIVNVENVNDTNKEATNNEATKEASNNTKINDIGDIGKINDNQESNSCKTLQKQKTEDIFDKVIFNNTPVQKYTKLTEKEERTYSFKDLLDWVHKKEKRDLFPKNKFDYNYKKNKKENENKPEIYNDEKNIVHMTIEEDIIPCLSKNPFIQADSYFKK